MFVSLRELEDLASKKSEPSAFHYYQTGANEQLTLKRNFSAFKGIYLNPRVLRDVSQISTKTTILGHQIDLPFGVAPSAMMKLAHPRGEEIPAEVCAKYRIPYTLSTLTTTSLENVSKYNGLRFFQLYIQRQTKNISLEIQKSPELQLKAQKKNGFHALVITVDAPIIGKREGEEKHPLKIPLGVKLELLESICQKLNIKIDSEEDMLQFRKQQKDQTHTWKTIKEIIQSTKLPVILKGIMHVQDALIAKQIGVNAIWVSNHGGRQLDTTLSTIEILSDIVQAVGPSVEVYMDGGVRSGTDIFKCLALGARCVFFARPVFYSIIVDDNGFDRVCSILENELISTMQLAGTTSISEIDRKYIVNVPKL